MKRGWVKVKSALRREKKGSDEQERAGEERRGLLE